MTSEIVVFGCGALGSQIAWHLACPARHLTLVDFDRVAAHNVGSCTTFYGLPHIGAQKAVVLSEILYRRAGCRTEAVPVRVDGHNCGAWDDCALLVDCFDNVASRRLLLGYPVPTLHVAVSADRLGLVAWDGVFRLPAEEPGVGNPVCTHQLGARILRLTAVLAAGVIEDFLATGERRSLYCTERGER